MRKVPLLRWDQIDQMVKRNEPPRVIHAEAILETDVPGKRTFAMQPLFSEGEIIFVNPDLPSEPGHYVVVESGDGRPEGELFRQLKEIGGQGYSSSAQPTVCRPPYDETAESLGPGGSVAKESLKNEAIMKTCNIPTTES
jgi:hypothetical protein